MEEWGAGVMATAFEAGLVGVCLVLAVGILRPEPRWATVLLLLGLAGFVVPGVITIPFSRPTLVATAAFGPVVEISFLSGLVLAQSIGLAVGVVLLLRGRRTVERILARSERVETGPAHRLLRETGAWYGIPTPRLFLTDGPGPMAVGVRDPAVLVPRRMADGFDHEALRLVLAHEAAHIARRDTLAGPLRLLAVSAWWFHPVVWALACLHRRSTEDACDDMVTCRASPRAYCEVLLDAARRAANDPGTRPVLGTAGLGGHPLSRRFRRILGGTRPTRGRPWLLAAIIAVAVIAVPIRFLTFETDAGLGSDARIVVEHRIVHEHIIR